MITIRKATIQDSPLLVKWFNDKNNMQYMSTYVRLTTYTEKLAEEELLDDSGDTESFIIECNGIAIGNVGLDFVDNMDKRAEIYYLIGERQYQGLGLSKSILHEILRYIFEVKKFNTVTATVTETNKISINMLLKGGFTLAGRYREYNYVDSRYLDELLFDITYKDWIQRRTE